ncbi:MAG: TonB-dependent receptor [Pseudomonadota bacterium]
MIKATDSIIRHLIQLARAGIQNRFAACISTAIIKDNFAAEDTFTASPITKAVPLTQRARLTRCKPLVISAIAVLGALFVSRAPINAEEQPKEAGATPEDSRSSQGTAPTDLYIYGAPFEAPLRDVPQSTTVVTEQKMQERGEVSFQDEIETLPNVMWSGGTARPRFLSIRGVGERSQYEGAPNPSVATIIDDIDFSGLGLVVPMFDIEQVEVLRGPQGVRFGSSALAGALNVRSHDPTEYTTGRVQLMAGNDDLLSGGVAVGGAVPGTDDKLQIRFSAFNSRSDGFRDNVFLGRDDTNQRDESVARLKLRYRPSANLSFDLALMGVEFNNGYDVFAIDNSFTTQTDKPGQDDTSARAASFKITSKVANDVTLESISSIARTSIDYSFDGDWGNNPFWAPYDPYDYFSDSDRIRKVIGQELRLRSADSATYQHGESWQWLAGLFGQRITEGTDIYEYSDNSQYDFLSSDYLRRTGAIFGQVEVPLGAKTSFVPGLRFEQRNSRYDDTKGADFSPTYSMLGGSASLQHDISDDMRGYLAVSRGYKGGGFNAGTDVPNDRRQYDPEYLWNFEVGAKGAFLDKKLQSDIALFYNLRREQQLKFSVQDNSGDPLSFTSITDSAAEGESIGIELANTYQATPWLQIFASGSIMDSQYTDVPDGTENLDGRAFATAPSWQYAAGSRIELGAGVFTRLEVTGKDAFYINDSVNEHTDPYSLFNATLGWRRDRWQVLAWSRNLFNERYDVRGFYFGNEPPDYPDKLYTHRGDPRAFGVTVSYAF